MKLGSEECIKALKEYETKSLAEELMIELLLIPEDADDELYYNMTVKICNAELTDEEFNTLDILVTKIRDELGIS